MAELQRRPQATRQKRENVAQPGHVFLEVPRQLKQDRPELFLERRDGVQELRERLVRVLESLGMRDALVGFQHKLKIAAYLGRPLPERRGPREHAVRVVDLDGTKILAVECEHLFFGEVFGIKRALPRRIRIAAGADVEVHGRPAARQNQVTESANRNRAWIPAQSRSVTVPMWEMISAAGRVEKNARNADGLCKPAAAQSTST